MSEADVKSFLDALPPERNPANGRCLADELVQQNKLTDYQAQQVCSGRGKSLAIGNYQILEWLGQGAMGTVFKAEHRMMKRVVALKVLSSAVTDDSAALRRFHREVQVAAKLEHPNIVIAHDADEADGRHFLVMQYVAGTDLAALTKETGALPVEQAVSCVLQVAQGLQYAHSLGVVHRDIKPSNLLLDHEGIVKVLDMGLARLESAQIKLTVSGEIMGTAEYMAPEQAENANQVDARADIYSLGMTLWYLLTGRSCYEGETTVERLMAHHEAPIPSLRASCLEASPQLEQVFTKMVAKTPAERYQSMAEVIADLERCQEGSPIQPLLAAQAVPTTSEAIADARMAAAEMPSEQPTLAPHKVDFDRSAPTAPAHSSRKSALLLGLLGGTLVLILAGVLFFGTDPDDSGHDPSTPAATTE
jgi:serine/threonine protein kinase